MNMKELMNNEKYKHLEQKLVDKFSEINDLMNQSDNAADQGDYEKVDTFDEQWETIVEEAKIIKNKLIDMRNEVFQTDNEALKYVRDLPKLGRGGL